MNDLDKLALSVYCNFAFSALFFYFLITKSFQFVMLNEADLLELLMITINTFFLGYFATRTYKTYRRFYLVRKFGREYSWNDKFG